uniref:Uncharacterized protein n=1 Tax=Cacopsylla melanoneura TaxID=428564 RepID=A0A8D8Y5W9_9HEMI
MDVIFLTPSNGISTGFEVWGPVAPNIFFNMSFGFIGPELWLPKFPNMFFISSSGLLLDLVCSLSGLPNTRFSKSSGLKAFLFGLLPNILFKISSGFGTFELRFPKFPNTFFIISSGFTNAEPLLLGLPTIFFTTLSMLTGVLNFSTDLSNRIPFVCFSFGISWSFLTASGLSLFTTSSLSMLSPL